MQPEKVPDEYVWPGAERVEFQPPPDHDQALLEILPVEALVDKIRFRTADGKVATGTRIHVRIGVDELDLATLKKNGFFWLIFYGGVTPFDVGHPEVDELLDVEVDDAG